MRHRGNVATATSGASDASVVAAPRARRVARELPSEVIVDFAPLSGATPAQRLARERGLVLLAQPLKPFTDAERAVLRASDRVVDQQEPGGLLDRIDRGLR